MIRFQIIPDGSTRIEEIMNFAKGFKEIGGVSIKYGYLHDYGFVTFDSGCKLMEFMGTNNEGRVVCKIKIETILTVREIESLDTANYTIYHSDLVQCILDLLYFLVNADNREVYNKYKILKGLIVLKAIVEGNLIDYNKLIFAVARENFEGRLKSWKVIDELEIVEYGYLFSQLKDGREVFIDKKGNPIILDYDFKDLQYTIEHFLSQLYN